MARGRWTDPEHNRFLAGMKAYGRSWKQIADNVVKTRTPEQVRIHAQKHFSKQGKTSKRKANKDGHWTQEEHELFLKCWAEHGRSWKKLSQIMKTRTNEQIRTHAQKYFHKLNELRFRGYDGRYDMDGTRHLTKTFLQRSGNKSDPPSFEWPESAHKRGGSSTTRRRSGKGKTFEYGSSDEEEEAASMVSSSQGTSNDGSERKPTNPGMPATYVTRSGREVTALWTQDMGSEDESEDEEDEDDEEDEAEEDRKLPQHETTPKGMTTPRGTKRAAEKPKKGQASERNTQAKTAVDARPGRSAQVQRPNKSKRTPKTMSDDDDEVHKPPARSHLPFLGSSALASMSRPGDQNGKMPQAAAPAQFELPTLSFMDGLVELEDLLDDDGNVTTLEEIEDMLGFQQHADDSTTRHDGPVKSNSPDTAAHAAYGQGQPTASKLRMIGGAVTQGQTIANMAAGLTASYNSASGASQHTMTTYDSTQYTTNDDEADMEDWSDLPSDGSPLVLTGHLSQSHQHPGWGAFYPYNQLPGAIPTAAAVPKRQEFPEESYASQDTSKR